MATAHATRSGSPRAWKNTTTGSGVEKPPSPTPGNKPRVLKSTPHKERKMNSEWPIWEVFVRSKQGLDHKHCGSLHAPDAPAALRMARDVYTRRQEGVSIWVVPSAAFTASDPADKAEFFDTAGAH